MADPDLSAIQELLSLELLKRATRNPRYSQRAFARDLGLSAPFLCHIKNGRRKLTVRVLQRINDALTLTDEDCMKLLRELLRPN